MNDQPTWKQIKGLHVTTAVQCPFIRTENTHSCAPTAPSSGPSQSQHFYKRTVASVEIELICGYVYGLTITLISKLSSLVIFVFMNRYTVFPILIFFSDSQQFCLCYWIEFNIYPSTVYTHTVILYITVCSICTYTSKSVVFV